MEEPKKSPLLKILFALLVIGIIALIVFGVKGEYFKGFMFKSPTIETEAPKLKTTIEEEERESSEIPTIEDISPTPISEAPDLDVFRPSITIIDTIDGTPKGEKVTGTFERPPTTLEKLISFKVEGNDLTGTEGNKSFRLESVEFDFDGCIMEAPHGKLKIPPNVKIYRITNGGEMEEATPYLTQLNDNWGTVLLRSCDDYVNFDEDTTAIFTVATNLALNCYYNKATITTDIKRVIYSDMAGNRYELDAGAIQKEAEATKTFMFNILDYI